MHLNFKFYRLLGEIFSRFPGVKFGCLPYQALERDKIQALKFKKANFGKKMIIYSAGEE